MRDDGQTDFLSRLWDAVKAAPTKGRPGEDVLVEEVLPLSSGSLRVRYVRHPRARRYRLLFRRDGTARCTVPRRGTLREARRFVASNEAWLAERLRRHQSAPQNDGPLKPGDPVVLRGQEIPLEFDEAAGGARRG
ncbi:MAG: M48 family metallopeptidase, partial [Verrucomicrobiae bacterium]|nr:M48 family metallopeptidase [Verrucomicrobiae bacterium]